MMVDKRNWSIHEAFCSISDHTSRDKA